MSAIEILNAHKIERKSQNNLSMVCSTDAVISFDAFVEKHCANCTTLNEIIETFDEAQDTILQRVTIGGKENPRPFLVDGMNLYKPFHVEDYTQLVTRILTEKGFKETFGLYVYDREEPVTIAQVEKAIKK